MIRLKKEVKENFIFITQKWVKLWTPEGFKDLIPGEEIQFFEKEIQDTLNIPEVEGKFSIFNLMEKKRKFAFFISKEMSLLSKEDEVEIFDFEKKLEPKEWTIVKKPSISSWNLKALKQLELYSADITDKYEGSLFLKEGLKWYRETLYSALSIPRNKETSTAVKDLSLSTGTDYASTRDYTTIGYFYTSPLLGTREYSINLNKDILPKYGWKKTNYLNHSTKNTYNDHSYRMNSLQKKIAKINEETIKDAILEQKNINISMGCRVYKDPFAVEGVKARDEKKDEE